MSATTNRRLALFLDGTWNTLTDNTNVWRLKSLCVQSGEQKVYYSAGVGSQRGEKLSGGMFGIGINEEVIAAYEWLIENYEEGDRLFVFGFSRGAFTARSLAGFISVCGLLRAGAPLSIKQLYARYRQSTACSIRRLQGKDANALSTEERWLLTYSRPTPIFFQGVWDSVGSLGVPVPWLPDVSAHDFQFLETDLRINDKYGFHALAIDEQRDPFKPTLWKKVTNKTGDNFPRRPIEEVEQRWFVGAHSNVGGGYDDDLLPQNPLRWIATKASEHGLLLKNGIAVDSGADTCPIHDSVGEMLHGVYELLTLNKRYNRPIGQDPIDNGSSTTENINETIDASVFARVRADPDYQPHGLLEWAQRRGVELSSIRRSVHANDPSQTVAEPAP